MITEKIYEIDGMCRAFRARVLSVEKRDERYAVLLDRTAFFPEGGGQSSDTGTIGNARVIDVQTCNGEILHFTDCAPSETDVLCELDFRERFRKMQNHLGEHLLCGAIHKLYGYDNVGFHLGADYMTFDIDGVMSADEIRAAEHAANEAVAADAPVRTYIPSQEELSRLSYRAKSEKLEAAEAIRIVEVEGYDRCACCAPHLDRAGKVGLIKIVDAMHYKGGMRFSALCGFDALADYNRKQEDLKSLSALLSAKPYEIPAAVRAKLDELSEAKAAIGALRRELISLKLAAITPSTAHICLFEPMLDANGARELATGGAAKTSGVCAVFSGADGTGYRFTAVSEHVPLREVAIAIREALGGKCGGSDKMVTGFVEADEAKIREFWAKTAISTIG